MTKIKDTLLIENDYSYTGNFIFEENNIITLSISSIDCCYIDNKINFTMQILAEKKEIFLTFDAKELLMCLSKNTINELKENLKTQIDNL